MSTTDLPLDIADSTVRRGRPRYGVLLLICGAIGVVGLLAAGPLLLSGGAGAPGHLPQDPSVNRTPGIFALGRVQPRGGVIEVSAPAGGADARIVDVLVQVGSEVTKGDVLATLDNVGSLEAALREAEMDHALRRAELSDLREDLKTAAVDAGEAFGAASAVYDRALADLSRAEALIEIGGVSRAELLRRQASYQDAASTLASAKQDQRRFANGLEGHTDYIVGLRRVELAKATQDRARADLHAATVRAPSSGTVLQIFSRPGERLPSEGLLHLGDLRSVELSVDVYQDQLAQVRVGAPARATSPALDRPLTGKVREVGLQVQQQSTIDLEPAANTDARVVEVVVSLDEESAAHARMFSNLQLNVEIQTE